jgi:RNA polymerase sigma factor (TIGR02999 family)
MAGETCHDSGDFLGARLLSEASRHDVSRLAAAAASGDGAAADELLPLVYEELRKLAHAKMAGEAPGTTLQPTALVHEAYLRIFRDRPEGWAGRAQFFSAAAEAMRRILVERARKRRSLKRGGGRRKLDLDAADPGDDLPPEDLLALDEALDRLEQRDKRASDVVKLRYFTGLTIEEVAETLGVAPRTVHRDWNVARAWLRVEVEKGDDRAG